MNSIIQIISSPWFLYVWGSTMIVSEAILMYDMFKHNNHLKSLMKLVWFLSVLYSSFLGLLVYYYSGRKEISKNSLARKAFRSVCHCYSGCGAGEVVGVLIAIGLLSLGNIWVVAITFILAYIFGYALTAGPLIQDGVPVGQAVKDALYSETASITIMEIVAISVDLWLAGEAGLGDVRFWSSLIISLTLGLVAAYPINVWLIKKGVKKGMHNPKQTHAH